MNETPNRRHVFLSELLSFFTATEDKQKLREEYHQIRREAQEIAPYLWEFLLPVGKKNEFPFVCSAWIGITHDITEEEVYPLYQSNDFERDLFMITFTDKAMIKITRQDIDQAQTEEERGALLEILAFYTEQSSRGINLFSFGELVI